MLAEKATVSQTMTGEFDIAFYLVPVYMYPPYATAASFVPSEEEVMAYQLRGVPEVGWVSLQVTLESVDVYM